MLFHGAQRAKCYSLNKFVSVTNYFDNYLRFGLGPDLPSSGRIVTASRQCARHSSTIMLTATRLLMSSRLTATPLSIISNI